MLGFEFWEEDGKEIAEGVVEEDVEDYSPNRQCSILQHSKYSCFYGRRILLGYKESRIYQKRFQFDIALRIERTRQECKIQITHDVDNQCYTEQHSCLSFRQIF